MMIGYSYWVRIKVTYSANPTYDVAKDIFINTASPAIEVAHIEGGNRVFSPDR